MLLTTAGDPSCMRVQLMQMIGILVVGESAVINAEKSFLINELMLFSIGIFINEFSSASALSFTTSIGSRGNRISGPISRTRGKLKKSVDR